MNSKQRKQSMTRRHMQWPIGAKVKVITITMGWIDGTISKHWGEYPHSCSVAFEKAIAGFYSHRIPFALIRLVDVHLKGRRPWYKSLAERHRSNRSR